MKLQVAAFLSFLIMPYALADDQGGLKKDCRILMTNAAYW